MRKKILYIHGFASSPKSSTVEELRNVVEDLGHELIAVELSFHPIEDVDMINQTILEEKPDLVIGTSLGGLYSIIAQTEEQDIPVLVINPPSRPTTDLAQFIGLNKFFNSRSNGATSFYFDEENLKEYKVHDIAIEKRTKDKLENLFVILSDHDEVLKANPKTFFEKILPEGHILVTSAIGHRLDKDFIRSTIKNVIETILDFEDDTYIDFSLEDIDINESFKNYGLEDQSKKLAYIDLVWDMLNDAYTGIGGFQGAESKEHLLRKSDFWKLCFKMGRLVAFALYKITPYGRKLFAGATDQSELGKKWFCKIIEEDSNQVSRHSYAEVSGKLEHLFRRLGVNLVPYEEVKKILFGKHLDQDVDPEKEENERYDFDKEYHYYRNLHSGVRHRKLMVGNPRKLE